MKGRGSHLVRGMTPEGARASSSRIARAGATAIFSALTLTTTCPALGYRTNADLAEITDSERVVWSTAVVTLEVTGNSPGPFAQDATRLALQTALQQWDAPPCSALRLQLDANSGPAAAPGDGRNTVQWLTDGWLGGADSPSYADVQFEKSGSGAWTIAEADIYLNSKHPTFRDPGATADYLRAILAHEIGHVVGLIHPCELTATEGAPICSDAHVKQLMHPLYSSMRTELSADDMAGLCFLYPIEASKPAKVPVQDSPPNTSVEPDNICHRNSDCPDGMHCSLMSCVGMVGELGDPCRHSGDCESSACYRFCSGSCHSDEDCRAGEICEPTAGVKGACIGERRGYGEPCQTADDCLSGYCVDGAAQTAICTRPCEENPTACPRDWVCEDLQTGDGKVCAPPLRELGGGGCACNVHQRGNSPTIILLLLIGALIGVNRRLRGRPMFRCEVKC